MVVYFSGTGNSRYCAQLIAKKLGDEIIDAANYIKQGIAAELISGRPWVFVSPVYAWQMPKIFADFIRSGSFEGCSEAYFVLTCGDSIGCAGEKIAALCREKGLKYMGVLPVVMPENYIAMFNVPDEERSARLIKISARRLANRVDYIKNGLPFPEARVSVMGKLLSGFVNKGFNAYYISDKKFYTTDGCTGCGKCAGLCPLNNIELAGGRPVWKGNCTHCMACICRCGAEAIEYGKKSIGKRRYYCGEYEGD